MLAKVRIAVRFVEKVGKETKPDMAAKKEKVSSKDDRFLITIQERGKKLGPNYKGHETGKDEKEDGFRQGTEMKKRTRKGGKSPPDLFLRA